VVGHHARREASALFGDAWRTLRTRKLRAFPLTVVWGLTVLVFAYLGHKHGAGRWIDDWAKERAGSSWWLFFVRLPGSLFAPAELLPFWAAWIQVTIVIGCCEVLLGWRRTLAVAAACHVLATLSARLFLAMGHRWVFGVARSYRSIPDSGPSAATLGLGMHVAVLKRAPVLFAVLLFYAASEVSVSWGLAQREHVIGGAVGLILALLWPRRARARPPARAGS
jgi:hypothetical protein